MGKFTARSKFNGEQFSLVGTTVGSVGVSTKFIDGQLEVKITGKDINATATGSLDATVIGGAWNDTFNFSAATGDYIVRTGAGNDTIIDGLGNNDFYGEGGADTFVFNRVDSPAPANEIDDIFGFVPADDTITLENGATPLTIAQNGADNVTITLSDGDIIRVQGTGLTEQQIKDEFGIV